MVSKVLFSRNLPKHLQAKNLSSTLSDALRTKYRIRSLPVRKGDTVRVLRGEFAGVEGKVTRVLRESGRVSIEGVTREKAAGGTAQINIHASKIMLTSLNLDDKWRQRTLGEKTEGGT